MPLVIDIETNRVEGQLLNMEIAPLAFGHVANVYVILTGNGIRRVSDLTHRIEVIA